MGKRPQRLYSKDDRHLILEGRSIEAVDKFTYLGATMSTEGGGEEDIQERLKKARAVFRNLNKTWKSSVFSRNTKIRIFNTVVKPTLLYGCETWKMTEGNNKMIDYFQTKFLGRILVPSGQMSKATKNYWIQVNAGSSVKRLKGEGGNGLDIYQEETGRIIV